MDKQVSITKVRNPFNKGEKDRHTLALTEAMTVGDMLFDICKIPPERWQHFNVVINGHVINNPNRLLIPGDSVVVVARIQDPGAAGDKDVTAILANIAIVILATIIGNVAGGATAAAGMSSGWVTFVSVSTTAVTMAAGSLLVNSLLPHAHVPLLAAGANLGLGKSPYDNSPAYGFTGGQTSYIAGLPYPVLYGKYPLPGQVVNYWISTDNSSYKQKYNALLFMAEGICKEPASYLSDISVNGISAASLRNVSFETTKGGLDQGPIQMAGFDKIHQYRPFSYEVECGPYILLHGDENPPEDSSYWGHTLSISGAARSADHSLFGGYSIKFTGNSDYVRWDESAHVHFDWEKTMTVRFGYKPTTLDGTTRALHTQIYNGSNRLFIGHVSSNKLTFYFLHGGNYSVRLDSLSDLVTDHDGLYYVEIAKIGNWYYLFIDGILQEKEEAVWPYHLNYWDSYPTNCGLGYESVMGYNSVLGYIDEFEMIPVEGHTSDYDIPTEATSDDFGLIEQCRGQADELHLTFELPYGLYNINTSAELENHNCDVAIYYRRKDSLDTWILRQVYLGYESGGTAVPSEGDIIEGATSGARGEWVTYHETSGDWASGTSAGNPEADLDSPGGILLRNVTGTFSAGENLNNVSTGDNNIATLEGTDAELIHGERIIASLRNPVRQALKIKNLDRDVYEVRIVRLSAPDADTQHVSNLFWTGFDELLAEQLNYPGASLMAISVEASERVRGANPNFSAIWNRGTIPVPDWFPVHNDYTDFTETDSGDNIEVLSWLIDVNDAENQDTCWLYMDFTSDHEVDGDFTVHLKVNMESLDDGAVFAIFGLSNTIHGPGWIAANSEDWLGVTIERSGSAYYIRLREYDGGTLYSDAFAAAELDTDYYLTIERDEDTGTYGTAYCRIYSDEARMELVDMLTVTLHSSKKDFQYFFPCSSWGAGSDAYGVNCAISDHRFVREVRSDNPAWADYDRKTNERYGSKVEPLNINKTNWLAWADWCDGIVKEILDLRYFTKIDALEEFLDDYTEVDAGSDIVVYQNKILFTALPRNLISYVYRDFGAAYFDADFEHRLKINISNVSADNALVEFWSLTNHVEDWQAATTGNHDFLSIYLWRSTVDHLLYLTLHERDGANPYYASYEMQLDTDYYLKVWRDENVGTYGTLYLKIYSDEEMKEELESLSLTLHTSKKDFRYLYGLRSSNGAISSTVTGMVENLNISPMVIDNDSIDFYDCLYSITQLVWKDYGPDFFNGDFTHYVNINIDAIDDDHYGPCVWALSNQINNLTQIDTDEGDCLAVYVQQVSGTKSIILIELVAGTAYTDSYTSLSLDTDYYLTVERDEETGDYGTLYCYIYSDSARTTLVDTLTLTLHEKEDFRYLSGLMSCRGGGAYTTRATGTISNLKISHKRITVNGIIDSQTSVLTAREKFEQLGRAKILDIGQDIDVVVEKPVDEDGELFSGGNILEGTNELEFIDRESRPDQLNIKFNNAAKNYEESLVPIYSSGFAALTRMPNIQNMFIWGVTSEDEARRYGILRMQMNERLNRITSHESDVDAIGCRMGDVIRKVHDSDETTFDGRLGSQSGMNNFRVKLDQEIEIVSDGEEENHKIWIRFENNTLVSRFIRGPWDTETDSFYTGALENVEDDYTEEDTNGHITVDGNDIAFAGLGNDEDAWVVRDFGAAYWDGDFEMQVDRAKIISSTGSSSPLHTIIWALTNDVDDMYGLWAASKSYFFLSIQRNAGVYSFVLGENDAGSGYQDVSANISLNTAYYLTIKRDESAGTYGTLYCYIYTDEARTTLFDTMSIALHSSKKDFRYLFGLMTYNQSVAEYMTGEVKNININGLSGDQAEYDLFAIGKTEAYAVTRYRLTHLGRTVDTIFRLTALEYDERIYTHTKWDGNI